MLRIHKFLFPLVLGFLLSLGFNLTARSATDVDWIGNAGVHVDVVSNVPVVQAAAYADGDLIGGKQTLTIFRGPNRSSLLRSIVITSEVDLTVNVDVILFSSDPSGTTFTENGAISIAAADAAKVIGIFTVSSRVDLGTPVVAQLQGLAIPLIGNGTARTIWAAMVVRGAYTPGAVDDVTLRLGVEEN